MIVPDAHFRDAFGLNVALSSDGNTALIGSESLLAGEGMAWAFANGGYAALGDSYSSGEGNPPFEPDSTTSSNKCHRSESTNGAYGPALDRDLALGPIAFRACSGAVTQDFFTINHLYGSEAQQLHWLTATTSTVTLTIGGDDAGFSNVLSECVTFTLIHYKYGCAKNKSLAQSIKTRLGALAGTATAATPEGVPIRSIREVIEAIHTDASHARIVVGGYPRLFGTSTTTYARDLLVPGGLVCTVGTFAGAPFSVDYADAQWLNKQGTKLDTVISNAVSKAAKRGIAVSYADSSASFDQHGFCDASEPWFHELQYAVSISNPFEPNFAAGPVPSSFHPTESGQREGYKPAFGAKLH